MRCQESASIFIIYFLVKPSLIFAFCEIRLICLFFYQLIVHSHVWKQSIILHRTHLCKCQGYYILNSWAKIYEYKSLIFLQVVLETNPLLASLYGLNKKVYL